MLSMIVFSLINTHIFVYICVKTTNYYNYKHTGLALVVVVMIIIMVKGTVGRKVVHLKKDQRKDPKKVIIIMTMIIITTITIVTNLKKVPRKVVVDILQAVKVKYFIIQKIAKDMIFYG